MGRGAAAETTLQAPYREEEEPRSGPGRVLASIHGLKTSIEVLHRKTFDHTYIGRHSCRRS